VWTFVLVLHLVSFGGDVRATIQTNDEDSCWRVRAAVLRALGGAANINGRVEGCKPVSAIQ
jgi:hypothetical protein